MLLSRVYDLSGKSNVWLTWYRWFYSDDIAGLDSYEVQVSNDGGLTWTSVERLTAKANAWTEVSYPLDPKKMAATPIPLHDGAARYYREHGHV